MQSTSHAPHVALIMDGNGRWATARGLPRLAGHHAGARAVERTVEAAARLGVGTLTLYAFSQDNWRRPATEVAGLMALFRRALARQVAQCRRNGVRLSVIGRRDRLQGMIVRAIEAAERETAGGQRLHLRLAVDYSGRDSILCALKAGASTREEIDRHLGPPVDLLVRTAGEQRLSDFLLWESAYAELVFTSRLWPEFGEEDLRGALQTFAARERRFGALPDAAREAVPMQAVG